MRPAPTEGRRSGHQARRGEPSGDAIGDPTPFRSCQGRRQPNNARLRPPPHLHMASSAFGAQQAGPCRDGMSQS